MVVIPDSFDVLHYEVPALVHGLDE